LWALPPPADCAAVPPFRARERMHDHAEPCRAAVFAGLLVRRFFLFVFIEIAGDGFLDLRASAGGDQERRRRCETEYNAEDEPGNATERGAENQRRQPQ